MIRVHLRGAHIKIPSFPTQLDEIIRKAEVHWVLIKMIKTQRMAALDNKTCTLHHWNKRTRRLIICWSIWKSLKDIKINHKTLLASSKILRDNLKLNEAIRICCNKEVVLKTQKNSDRIFWKIMQKKLNNVKNFYPS